MTDKIKILVIHGPNLNLLGIREPEIYGRLTLAEINQTLKDQAGIAGHEIDFFQSNHEGAIIDKIQECLPGLIVDDTRRIIADKEVTRDNFKKIATGARRADGIIINPAAYTHTSVAIRDAIKAVGIPTVEVHLSDIMKREEFRKISYIREVAIKQFSGEGLLSYTKGLDFLIQYIHQLREKTN